MEVAVSNPFPFEALPRIWRWIDPFRTKVSDDFSPQNLGDFVSAMGRKWDSMKTWAVSGDGELGGLITFERLSPWLGTAHLILKPELQGKGVAVKACRLAFAAMFQEGIGKLSFYPLAGNLAVGSLLINIGAKREGRLEQHTVCGGKPTDIYVYGLSRGAFEDAYRNSSRNADLQPGRSGDVSCRVAAVREEKDCGADQQHHADPHAGNAGAHGPAVGLLEGIDGQSVCGSGSD